MTGKSERLLRREKMEITLPTLIELNLNVGQGTAASRANR